MMNISSKAVPNELVIPRFASMNEHHIFKGLPPQHQMFNPLLAAQRLNADSCQQAMHINMLLHQFLLRAATMGQQTMKQPANIPPMYGAMHFNKSSVFNNGNFHLPPFPPQLDGKVPSSVLLTPPLSERSRGSSAGLPSPPSYVSEPTKINSQETAGSKRQHKGSNKPKLKKEAKRMKANRKLTLNEQSPISGILIKRVSKEEGQTVEAIANNEMRGDIDSKYNVVDKSEESKKRLSKIKNVIGDFVCRLCEVKFVDVYHLAEHRCPSIIYIEYKCPECFKVFNCPANLASHRRWHKPKAPASGNSNLQTSKPTKNSSIERKQKNTTKILNAM